MTPCSLVDGEERVCSALVPLSMYAVQQLAPAVRLLACWSDRPVPEASGLTLCLRIDCAHSDTRGQTGTAPYRERRQERNRIV
jgi:hypothetical protein